MSEADKIRRIREELEKAIREVTSSESLKKLAEDLPERIKVRTRLGYGVSDNGGPRKRLEPLAASTKRSKNYKKKSGKLSNQTTPNRSNLTDTGELLDNLVVESSKDSEVTIKPKGERNEKVARYVTEQGREFLNLSKPELKGFLDNLGKALLDKINKVLKS
jgi:hypothetical protein